MKQSFYERLQTSMYPSKLLHKYGVNGKISGSIYALSEMEGVIPIIHSPRGCGYHYRYSARRRMSPYFDVCSTNLSEKDIIFSGEEKLYETIKEVNKVYNPKLIVVIPSPISDIIYDDIEGVVCRAKGEGINVIGLTSELFSHRDKTFAARKMKEFASQKLGNEKDVDFDIKGCGYTEAMYAVVDQIMKPQRVIEKTVNIETIGWAESGTEVLDDLVDFLKGVGIKVNTYFPSANYEDIITMPQASLNIVRRIKWAKLMKEKFGTPFMKVHAMREYSGLAGIGRFYSDVGAKLTIEKEMNDYIKAEQHRTLQEARPFKENIGKYKGVFILKNVPQAPYLIKKYMDDYGMNIRYICVCPMQRMFTTLDLSQASYKALINKIHDSVEGRNVKLLMEPDEEILLEITAECDYIVGSNDYSFEKYGKKVLHSRYDIMGISYASYLRSLRLISQKLDEIHNKNGLLLNRFEYNKDAFPLINYKDTLNTEKMWQIMWHQREK